MRCLMPIDVSAASYIPGASLARGSLASEPVIPAGSGAAGAGANGLAGAAGVAEGEGEGDDVCAWMVVAKHNQQKREAKSKRKCMVCTRFIVSPLAWCRH